MSTDEHTTVPARRRYRAALSLPADPSDEELARDWTLSAADKEALLAEAASTLRRMRAEHPGVDLIVQHYSYALFPTVIKGGLVMGGARSQGVVYEQGRHVGYCDLTQGSLGYGSHMTSDQVNLQSFMRGTVQTGPEDH
jgi:hypothetical protein